MSLSKIKHIILVCNPRLTPSLVSSAPLIWRQKVLSGKGGVGKSSVTTQLALSLSLAGHSVGVLNINLTGPSIPRMFAVEDAKVVQSSCGWLPISVHTSFDTKTGNIGSLCVMSLGFLLQHRDNAVVWRGPKKTAMVRQFFLDVNWDALDYLLINTPPGTGDEQISLAEALLEEASSNPSYPDQVSGVVVVTTPQAVATADVRKSLNFCAKTGLRVLGIVENMSLFICLNCSECTDLFRSEGGRLMAEECSIRFLRSVPINPEFGMLIETGRRPRSLSASISLDLMLVDASNSGDTEESVLLVKKYCSCALALVFKEITHRIVEIINPSSSLEPQK